jgi:dihydroorotase-like cyclic amidohydrolase
MRIDGRVCVVVEVDRQILEIDRRFSDEAKIEKASAAGAAVFPKLAG